MAASVQATQAVVRVSPAIEIPYGVLLLPAVLEGTPQRQELLLPLTLAYLLSAHIAFQFPMHESGLVVVEHAFDDILKGLPKESKGIRYRSVERAERASALVPQSSLLLTDERGRQATDGCESLPAAVISRPEGNNCVVLLQNLEKVSDLGLRSKLASCAQLINVQSTGFITEGHFSLSW